ncbi:uncharacterized protein LOC130896337 [Diorhabda carinulata]|uniref:uncharacterized protein LOC130896337 n=1 Tax=Diorhabda carinulata TaxID=1163345 RepID=UPI0025A1E5C1|nr:uncharacterized protein LOC130896337 [Diorhabda carinulata]
MMKILCIGIILELSYFCYGESGYSYPKPEHEKIDISKFVYYFKPPPEEPKPTEAVPLPAPSKKKLYRYIFIQAPRFPQPSPIVPVQPQTEEKTIVYVLSEKEKPQKIFLPTPVPHKQLSPEVYYINYGLKKNEGGHYGPPKVEEKSTEKPSTTLSSSVEIKSAVESASVPSPPGTSYGVPILPSPSYGVPFNPDYRPKDSK